MGGLGYDPRTMTRGMFNFCCVPLHRDLIALAIDSLAHESSHICGGGSRWGVVPGPTYRFKGHVGAATLLLRTVTHRMGLYRYQGSIGGNLAATFTKGKPSLKKEKAKPGCQPACTSVPFVGSCMRLCVWLLFIGAWRPHRRPIAFSEGTCAC